MSQRFRQFMHRLAEYETWERWPRRHGATCVEHCRKCYTATMSATRVHTDFTDDEIARIDHAAALAGVSRRALVRFGTLEWCSALTNRMADQLNELSENAVRVFAATPIGQQVALLEQLAPRDDPIALPYDYLHELAGDGADIQRQ